MKRYVKCFLFVFTICIISLFSIIRTEAATVGLNSKKATVYAGTKDNQYQLNLTNAIKNIVWKSLNNEIATVDKNGLVTAVNTGKTYIVASFKGKEYKCRITVKKPALVQKNVTLFIDDTYSVAVNGANIIKVISYNKSVVKADDSCVLTAIGIGEAVVAVKCDNQMTYKLTVKVVIRPDAVKYGFADRCNAKITDLDAKDESEIDYIVIEPFFTGETGNVIGEACYVFYDEIDSEEVPEGYKCFMVGGISSCISDSPKAIPYVYMYATDYYRENYLTNAGIVSQGSKDGTEYSEAVFTVNHNSEDYPCIIYTSLKLLDSFVSDNVGYEYDFYSSVTVVIPEDYDGILVGFLIGDGNIPFYDSISDLTTEHPGQIMSEMFRINYLSD